MKLWSTIAQNVISGCVGGLIVMSSAQAQRPSETEDSRSEIRTQRLVIVDRQNNERGRFCAHSDGAELRLQSPQGYLQALTASSFGSSISVGAGSDSSVCIDVNSESSVVNARGKNAKFSVGNEKGKSLGSLSYNLVPHASSVDLRGPGGFHWSQPSNIWKRQ
jgi:hypothetical protein